MAERTLSSKRGNPNNVTIFGESAGGESVAHMLTSPLSRGLLRRARNIAEQNLLRISDQVSDQVPIIGVEPSALLTFRDEYPVLVGVEQRDAAQSLAGRSWLLDEFLVREFRSGKFSRSLFTRQSLQIQLHGRRKTLGVVRKRQHEQGGC